MILLLQLKIDFQDFTFEVKLKYLDGITIVDDFEIDSQFLHNIDKFLDSQDEEDIDHVVNMIMNLIKVVEIQNHRNI